MGVLGLRGQWQRKDVMSCFLRGKRHKEQRHSGVGIWDSGIRFELQCLNLEVVAMQSQAQHLPLSC